MGALIGKFVRAARSGAPTVEVWGDGGQEREFIHVEDVVDGLLQISETPNPIDVLNLGVGQAYSIGDLARLIKKLTGYSGQIVFNTNRFVGAKTRLLDSTRIAKEIGWKPKVDLAAGITSAIAWYASHLDHTKK
jgi:GDP-L-fucose synthase